MTRSFGDAAKDVLELRDDLADKHDEATEEGINTLQRSVRRHLIRQDSVARTTLLRDILTGRTVSTDSRTITSRAVHLPDWAKYVEYGTGERGATDSVRGSIPYPEPSGLPPFDPILTWVIAKNLTSPKYDSQYALASAIQRTIGDQGTFAHPFLRPAWRNARGKRNIVRLNKRAMSRAVRRF